MSDAGHSSSGYEVLAVRYGRRVGKKGETYLNYHLYGEPDGPLPMDYFVWVVRNAERTVVVDTGFRPEVGTRRGRELLVDPPEGLAEVGVDAASAEVVVATHAHYDHIGNLHRFPAAEVVVSRREYEFWRGPYGRRLQFASSTEEPELAVLAELGEKDRLSFVDGRHQLAPGIEVIDVGGHTPGQMVVVVQGASGQVVLASDAVHYYEEYERDRPFSIVADLADAYRAFDTIRELTSGPGGVLVAGHDPDVMTRFPPYPGAPEGLAVQVA
ncbi:MAG: N-acyl homoserine lactonase family protein [Acidimicrobiaceae bacterium]|nr:N-acyl homoserine lactonase family protein [Acidimicrobiaceae bacterium]